MGIFNFLKRFFFRKKHIQYHKQQEQVFEKKQEPSQFNVLLENLEKNRDKIIQERKDKEFKILPLQTNGRFIQLNKKLFQIDEFLGKSHGVGFTPDTLDQAHSENYDNCAKCIGGSTR